MAQNAWTLTYTNVMGLCRLSYKKYGLPDKSYKIFNSVWKISVVDQNGPYRAIIAEGKDSLNKPVKVMSFSGTDEKRDWGLSGNLGNFLKSAQNTGQYQYALNFAETHKPNYCVGHSLGGGLALYSGLLKAVKTATINPSPLFNDVFGIHFEKYNGTKEAINYCVPGEILERGRKLAAVKLLGLAAGATPGMHVTVASNGKSEVDKHLLANLVGFAEPVIV